ITGAALYHSSLGNSPCFKTHAGAYCVPVGLCARKLETNASVSGELVITIQKSRSVVGGQQEIDIAVTVEIAVRETSSHLRLAEVIPHKRTCIHELRLAVIQE